MIKPMALIPNSKGTALIALVAAILLFSVLAAAIVPMVSSSHQQSITTHMAAKAYLLAESGYRYSASQFLHAGAFEQSQNLRLEDLDGDYHLENGQGQFNLKVFSYFYELTTAVNGESQFTAHAPGNFPGAGSLPNDPGDEVALSSGLKIAIGKEIYTLTAGSSAVDGSEDQVTFFVNPSLAPFPEGTPVYPVADIDLGSNDTLTNGDNLTYENGDGRMFPLRNGTIQVNGRTMTYRFNNRSANQLVDVRAPNHPGMLNFDLNSDPFIHLTRYVRLHATGTYGAGGSQIQRQVVYYTPLPPTQSGSRQESFSDRFDNDDNWSDTTGTITQVGDVGGDSALKVDATTVGTDQRGGLTIFTPTPETANAIDFGAAQRGSRGYLSYDTQIKIGYENIPAPAQGFFPSPIPAYVGAGISFRLGGDADLFNNNSYGLSILRGNDSRADDIPNAFVPFPDERTLVLWRQIDNGDQRTWLAYKRLTDLLRNEDDDPLLDEDNEVAGSNAFNDGAGATDLWDLEPVVEGQSSRQREDSTRNWYFGIGAEHTYNWKSPPFTGTPVRSLGTIETSNIDLPAGALQIALTFWSWHETEPGSLLRPLDSYDLKQVIVLGTPNTTYTIDGDPAPEIFTPPGADGWYQARVDLSAYAGQTVRIQFHFDTVDEIENNYEGWYIDDVQLRAQWSAEALQEATLALRLKEAMVVRFNNGTHQIRQGDRIYGARGTTGTVLIPPLINSGAWGLTTPATGTLLLNNTTVVTTGDPFESGERLFVMGNTGQARVSAWNSAHDTKANILQVYLATKQGRGSGNGNPLDVYTEPYGRIGVDPAPAEIYWPPVLDHDGNWIDGDGAFDASKDYFQLIEWDQINPAVSGLSFLSFTPSGGEVVEKSMLQSHHIELNTPDYPGLYQQPELGLHTMGDGADNIYFDDFGIQLNVFESEILPSPIQQ